MIWLLISVYQEKSNIYLNDIINILNHNHSVLKSCTSKKVNNHTTYYITLIRKKSLPASLDQLQPIKMPRKKRGKYKKETIK